MEIFVPAYGELVLACS